MTQYNRWNKDLIELTKENFKNVLYHYDQKNTTELFIIVIGLDNTPYQGGFYPFKLQCGPNYPHDPPHVTFLGESPYKIHPNLHQNGYVCLSLLNKNDGINNGWTPIMTINSLILSILSLFTNDPLKCEPLYEKGDLNNENHINYQKIAEFYNYKHYIDEFIKNPVPYELADKVMDYFVVNFNKYQDRLLYLQTQNLNPEFKYSVFDGDLIIDYSHINLF